MRVRFWGVRGSVPYATRDSIGHGCNTACVEVISEQADRRLILDAGSGIVGAGAAVSDAREIPIVLTHYHWDHVQGLPFFAPLYRQGVRVTVWAPALERSGAGIDTLFEPPFFPVPYDRLSSQPAIRTIVAGETTINGFELSAQPLNHPGGSFAYRIRGSRGDLVYATDHEFGNSEVDAALTNFAFGAKALILDSHFTPDEMPDHKGRGHSDWERCARFAGECGAGHLWLFHHKPGRSDREISEIEEAARGVFDGADAAKEGHTFHV